MKETGMIMSDPMIQAYLAGRKTQTRRTKGLTKINKAPNDWALGYLSKDGAFFTFTRDESSLEVHLPYGWKGDTLYFKECWQLIDGEAGTKNVVFRSTDQHLADRWRSPLFMFRQFSRFRYIPILGVRIERLNEITEDDARAEGLSRPAGLQPDYRYRYFQLWNRLNGDKVELRSWHNPWVWVYEFPPHE